MMLVEIQNVEKKFAEKVLDGISIKLDYGESLSITGPSGSGKSTVLSIMGLLLEPNSGEVYYKGRKITNLPEKEVDLIRNQGMGFIFQDANLIGSLNVLDNVLVPAYIAKSKTRKQRAEKLLEDLGLKDRMDYYPNELSIGQKRRVALARALVMEPSLILADEPTNDLDPKLSKWIREYLYSLVDEKTSLIVVTHDQELAKMADRSIILESGYIEEGIYKG